MTPAPLEAQRLALLGCTLGVALALALSACGSDGAATAQSTAATAPKPGAGVRGATSRPCPAKLDAFADSLDRLRHQLAIGLSYGQYAGRVRALQGAYEEIPVGRLAIACLRATGSPAERAFNKYADAANAWGECLADASCTTAAIEPVLQRKWRLASSLLPD